MKKVITTQITYILLCMVLSLFIVPQLGAQDAPAEAIQAAEEGLPIFLSLIPPSEMENYGFSEDDNLDDAVLGSPFLQYLIYETDVENYKEGDTVYDVLTESSSWYFPVMIGDESKCLLTVDKMDDNWEAVSFGDATVAQWVALVREVWPISEGYDPLFSINYTVNIYYFTIPQVDQYNLTQINYWPQIESEDELIQLYEDLRPLSEAMEYIASQISHDDDNEYSGIGFGSEGGEGGCFISTLKLMLMGVRVPRESQLKNSPFFEAKLPTCRLSGIFLKLF